MLESEGLFVKSDAATEDAEDDTKTAKAARLISIKEDLVNAGLEQDVLDSAAYHAMLERQLLVMRTAPVKEMVSVWFDRDVLEALRAFGPNLQERINEMLRTAVLG